MMMMLYNGEELNDVQIDFTDRSDPFLCPVVSWL